MKLHIHFGIHRTGTTSIHKALSASAEILKSHGILYPDLGVGRRHVKLAWQIKSGKVSPDEVIERIQHECNELTELVVLSSEDFCLVDIESWLSLLGRNFDVTASVYLKRQDKWLESWYNQHIKWPWSKKFSSSTPDFFVENMKDFYWIDYEKLLGRIASIVPREKLYINVAGPEGVQDTVSDFLYHVGVDKRWLNPYQDRNASLTTARLDILRRIDIQPLGPKARQRVLAALSDLDVEEDDGRKVVFDNSKVDYILKKFSASNKKVAKKYFSRRELFDCQDLNGKRAFPAFVTDDKAYREYIPEILKSVSMR